MTTIGDDIAWIKPHADGRFYAINPEAGYFGVAPGTSHESNPNAMEMLTKERDLHQRRADRRRRRLVGRDDHACRPRISPTGRASRGRRAAGAKPRIRMRASPWRRRNARRSIRDWDDPAGVPIDAFVFGARRSDTDSARRAGDDLGGGRLQGGDDGLGDHRRRHRRRGRSAARSVRDAAVLRLSHRRLFRALARHRQARCRRRRRSSTSTGFAPTPTASSSGRASARTCACWRGSSSAARGAGGAAKRPLGFEPAYGDLNWARPRVPAGAIRRA